MEIWKEVKDFEGIYEISNYGRLKSKDRYVSRGRNTIRFSKGKIIKPVICRNGYLEYQLRKDGKRKVFLAHRLVAETFISNPKNLPQINHLDENITNNNVTKLQWCTAQENANYGTRNKRAKISNRNQQKAVLQLDLDGEYINEFECIGDASRAINGDISAIIRVCKGKNKTAYGYIWKYKNC